MLLNSTHSGDDAMNTENISILVLVAPPIAPVWTGSAGCVVTLPLENEDAQLLQLDQRTLA